ncbi:MAG: hypothetical protein IIA88_02020 [Bacteroidetes bacterium]|nr:hypothetical protein [Bacteroidota bacterium]
MTKIELTIDDRFSKIDTELRNKLLTGAIRKVASVQLKDKEKELAEAKKNNLKFEKKYHRNYENFKKTLPKEADYKLHEDFVEWSFWNDVFTKAQHLVKDLRFVLGKTDE